MNFKWKKSLSLILCMGILLLCSCASSQSTGAGLNEAATSSVQTKEILSSWTEGTGSERQQIVDYITRITDVNDTEHYIPVENRIAVFDMDGTIVCEKPLSLELNAAEYRITKDLAAQEELNEKLKTLKKDFEMENPPADIWDLYAEVVDSAFEGMTDDEVTDYFADFVQNTPTQYFENLNYVDTFYQPMIELIQYLQDNHFQVFLVSGSMRSVVWGCVEGYNRVYQDNPINLDRSHMIGSDVEQIWIKETDSISSDFEPSDKIVFGQDRTSTNIAMTKVYNIAQQVGRVPVFACGNTDGDFSMLNYAKSNEYDSMALLVWHDSDDEVVYNISQEWQNKADQYGWNLISMKNDFQKIFMTK